MRDACTYLFIHVFMSAYIMHSCCRKERVCGRPEDMSGPTCGVEIIKSEELGDAAHTKVLRPFVRWCAAAASCRDRIRQESWSLSHACCCCSCRWSCAQGFVHHLSCGHLNMSPWPVRLGPSKRHERWGRGWNCSMRGRGLGRLKERRKKKLQHSPQNSAC